MQRHAYTPARQASRPSASSRTQSIQSASSSGYMNPSGGTAAADYLRVKYVGSVHGDPVFVNRELSNTLCFSRFRVSVVKLLSIIVKRGILLELDEEIVSGWRPRHCVTHADVHRLRRCPIICVHVYGFIAAREVFGLFFDFLSTAARSKHQEQSQAEPARGTTAHGNGIHRNLLYSIFSVESV